MDAITCFLAGFAFGIYVHMNEETILEKIREICKSSFGLAEPVQQYRAPSDD